MTKTISLLGATGSIGRQTLAVAQELGLSVAALTANRQVDLLEQQARQCTPRLAVLNDPVAAKELRGRLQGMGIEVMEGPEGLIAAATLSEADTVVTAVMGSVGLAPTLAAIREKKRIALANKETLVCAGELVMAAAQEAGAEIVPVDSEHSAIFQCLQGCRDRREIRRLLLTCSGGPFFGRTFEELEHMTAADALKHPNWTMGAKITIDSATLMNKGLEFIEAMHLFSVTPDDIQVVIHPQSVIHSMVELVDGTVIAQLGAQDMRLPIQLALSYPERVDAVNDRLDFYNLADLSFYAPDLVNTPCLALAMDAARTGGTAGCVMSAANEEAVRLFLNHKLGYNRIYDCAAEAIATVGVVHGADLDAIIEADAAARRFVKEKYGSV